MLNTIGLIVILAWTFPPSEGKSGEAGTPRAAGRGQQPTEQTPRRQDQDLLRGLGGIPPKADPSRESSLPATAAGTPVTLSPGLVPLRKISLRMQDAEAQLAVGETGASTRTLQNMIVSELKNVVAELERQANASKSDQRTGQQAASQATATSPRRGNDPETAATQNSERLIEEAVVQYWGHLPQQLQSQLQNARGVRFLPKYQESIEAYYRRLAEGESRD